MTSVLNKRISESRKVIRAFIQKHWDDQRLHDVYAFNADGKMRFASSCCCLMGVTLAETLHSNCQCIYNRLLDAHYFKAQRLPGGLAAEEGYRVLGYYLYTRGSTPRIQVSDELRRLRLSALLRAEIRRRVRKEAAAETDRPRVTAEV